MKPFFLLITLFLVFSCKQNDNPPSPQPDSQVGWVVGRDSLNNQPLILKTVDGGANWIKQNVPSEFAGQNICLLRAKAFTDNLCWVIGYKESDFSLVILKSTDGGSNWQRVGANLTVKGTPTDIVTKDGQNLLSFVTDAGSNFFISSSDAGQTWSSQEVISSDTTYFRTQCLTTTDDFSWIVSVGELRNKQDGQIVQTALYWSKDGGQSWAFKPITTPAEQEAIISVSIPSKTVIYTSGDRILKSSDGGESFTQVFKYARGHFNCITAIDNDNVWSVYDPTVIFNSKDGGANWSKIIVPDEQGKCLNRVEFINKNKNGVAVGSTQSADLKGVILYSNDFGATWAKAQYDNNGFFEDVSFVQTKRR